MSWQVVGNAALEAVTLSLISSLNFVPRLVSALIIVAVGLIVGDVIRKVVIGALDLLKVSKILDESGFSKALRRVDRKFSFKGLVGSLVRWFVIIAFLLPATNVLGLSQVGEVLNAILLYIPNVIVAVVIVMLGAILGQFARDLVVGGAASFNSNIAQALGRLAQWSIVIFAVMAALTQLGVAANLIQILFTGLVAMIAVAGGIAFGLGGVDTAKEILAKLKKEFEK
jgi:hypothetical protein